MPFDITIITRPVVDIGGKSIPVRTDTTLVKAAILYADTVTLVSASSSMLLDLKTLAATPRPEQLDQMIDLLKGVKAHAETATQMEALVQQFRETEHVLGRKKPAARTKAETLALGQARSHLGNIQRELAALWENDMVPAALRTTGPSGVDELEPAINAGVLTVPRIGGLLLGDSAAGFVTEYMARISLLLSGITGSLPLFDEGIGSLARSGLREGLFGSTDRTTLHARKAAVGVGLPTHLPAFVDPPMSEVLSIRAELTDPLTRYRAAVLDMAKSIDADPFDGEMSLHVADLYEERVAPAMLEITETLTESRFRSVVGAELLNQLTTIIRSAGKYAAGGTIGSALSLGVAGVSNTPDLPAMVEAALQSGPVAGALVGAALPAADAVISARKIHQEQQGAAKKHGLYFLHETNVRLGAVVSGEPS